MKKIACVLILCLFVPAAAAENQAEFGLIGSYAIPPNKAYNPGYGGAFWIGIAAEKYSFSSEFSYLYSPDNRSFSTEFGKINHKSELDIYGFGINAKYFLRKGFLSPFVGIGIGVSWLRETHKVENSDEKLASSPNAYVKPSLGMYFFVTEDLALVTDISFSQSIFYFNKQKYKNTGLTGISNMNNRSRPAYLALSAGFSFRI